jgi:transcriptional regulator with XRE-family HTH domain
VHPIERYRRAKGWTQSELAAEVGVSLNTVQAWEKGSMPRPKVGRKLAEVFGVDPLQLTDELVSYKNSQAAVS